MAEIQLQSSDGTVDGNIFINGSGELALREGGSGSQALLGDNALELPSVDLKVTNGNLDVGGSVFVTGNLSLATGQSIEDGSGNNRLYFGSGVTKLNDDSGTNRLKAYSGGSITIQTDQGEPFQVYDKSTSNYSIKYSTGTLELINTDLDVDGSVSVTGDTTLTYGRNHGASTGQSTVVGIGARALEDTTGTLSDNDPRTTAVGHEAARNSEKFGVTVTGYRAAQNNTGNRVTASGLAAAKNNTGNRVTASGYQAAQNNTGNSVAAVGWRAAQDNTGNNVTASGFQAAEKNTGNSVTASGVRAAKNNTGSRVTASGYQAAKDNTGFAVTASGYQAAQDNIGDRVTASGLAAAKSNTGFGVTVAGYQAAENNTGGKVTASGYRAAENNTGFGVTASGYQAARDNTENNVTSLGYQAARDNTGSRVTALGYEVAENNTGSRVTASGFRAVENNTGNGVTVAGYLAARGDGLADPTTMGDDNIGIGESAIRNNQASGLIAIGQDAGINAQTDDQFIVTDRNGNRRFEMDLTNGDINASGDFTTSTFHGADIANASTDSVPVSNGDGTLTMGDPGSGAEIIVDDDTNSEHLTKIPGATDQYWGNVDPSNNGETLEQGDVWIDTSEAY